MQDRTKPIRPKGYARYIRSPQWFAKRAAALAHHGAYCKACGTTARLHVHHLTYQRLGIERMDDLLPLCEDCHQRVHEWHAQVRGPLAKASLDAVAYMRDMGPAAFSDLLASGATAA